MDPGAELWLAARSDLFVENIAMPRGSKTARRQLINAGMEYKKGNRKEAYELWANATKARVERYEGKHFKKKRAEEAVATEKAAAEKAATEKAEAEAAKAAADKAAEAEKAAAAEKEE